MGAVVGNETHLAVALSDVVAPGNAPASPYLRLSGQNNPWLRFV
jgi:hypothetical protein